MFTPWSIQRPNMAGSQSTLTFGQGGGESSPSKALTPSVQGVPGSYRPGLESACSISRRPSSPCCAAHLEPIVMPILIIIISPVKTSSRPAILPTFPSVSHAMWDGSPFLTRIIWLGSTPLSQITPKAYRIRTQSEQFYHIIKRSDHRVKHHPPDQLNLASHILRQQNRIDRQSASVYLPNSMMGPNADMPS